MTDFDDDNDRLELGGVDIPRIEAAVREILIAIGEDPDRDGLKATPNRVARAYDEIVAGLRDDPGRHLVVTFEAGHDEMVMVKDIPFVSVCEHHLVPFMGDAHVAYIPNDDGRRSKSGSPRRSPTRSSARWSLVVCSW